MKVKERRGLRAEPSGTVDVKGSVQGEKEGPAKETEKEQPVRWKENQESVVKSNEEGFWGSGQALSLEICGVEQGLYE